VSCGRARRGAGRVGAERDRVPRRARLATRRGRPRSRCGRRDRSATVAGLQVEPELGAGPEMTGEPQRRVRADGALAVQDRRDPARRDAQRQRQPVSRHAARRQLTPQDATRVDRNHRGFPEMRGMGHAGRVHAHAASWTSITRRLPRAESAASSWSRRERWSRSSSRRTWRGSQPRRSASAAWVRPASRMA
jgi:hypothetical protein